MNNTATPVHIIEAQQNLLRNVLTNVHRYTLVLMSLDQTKEVFSEHFKNHANVDTVWPFVSEMIKE